MSWQATAWAERQVTGSPSRKVLLLVLANYADEFGICWPSQEVLAKGTEQSLDTVQRQLRRLAEMGLIAVAVRPQGRGRWPGRTYKLNMPAVETTEPQPAARSEEERRGLSPPTEPQPAGDRAATSTPHRAATSPATEPQALRLKPSIEPSLGTFIEPSGVTRLKPRAAERLKTFEGKRWSIEVVQNRIAKRLGADGWLILQSISDRDLQMLTRMQEHNRLSDADLEQFRLLWKQRGAA